MKSSNYGCLHGVYSDEVSVFVLTCSNSNFTLTKMTMIGEFVKSSSVSVNGTTFGCPSNIETFKYLDNFIFHLSSNFHYLAYIDASDGTLISLIMIL